MYIKVRGADRYYKRKKQINGITIHTLYIYVNDRLIKVELGETRSKECEDRP